MMVVKLMLRFITIIALCTDFNIKLVWQNRPTKEYMHNLDVTLAHSLLGFSPWFLCWYDWNGSRHLKKKGHWGNIQHILLNKIKCFHCMWSQNISSTSVQHMIYWKLSQTFREFLKMLVVNIERSAQWKKSYHTSLSPPPTRTWLSKENQSGDK